jgi:hypothetical protein
MTPKQKRTVRKTLAAFACACALAATSHGQLLQLSVPPPDNSHWMADMAPLIGNIPLNQLAIPGTHDSATYYLDGTAVSPDNPSQLLSSLLPGLFVPWSQAQAVDLTTQLNRGIRYLDLRVCARYNGEFDFLEPTYEQLYFCHGYFAHHVETAITAARDFIAANPQELLILDFNHFYAVSPFHHDQLGQRLEEVFGDKLIPYTIDVATTTLNDLWQTPGRVIVLYREEGDDGPLRNRLQMWPGSRIVSAWPAAAGWSTLNARVTANAECRCDTVNTRGDGSPIADADGSKLFVLQTQATPDPGYVIGQTLIPFGLGEQGLGDLAAHRDLVYNVRNLADRFPWSGGTPVRGATNIIINDWFHNTNLVEMVKSINARYADSRLLRTWMNDFRFMWADSTTGLFFPQSMQGQVSSPEGPESTDYAPALAPLGNRVVAAWLTQDRIYSISWADGQFSDRVHVSDALGLENTGTPPALAAFNGRVYMAWIAQDFHLALLSTGDGRNWERVAADVHGVQTGAIPALATHNGRLHVAYLGQDDEMTIMSSADGVTWTNPVTLGAFSDWGPGLISFNGRLQLAWKGEDDHLMLWSSADGVTFDSRIVLPEKVVRNPALARFRGRLALGWIGTNDHPNIMFSADGRTFVDKVEDRGVEADLHDLRANGLSLLPLPLTSVNVDIRTFDGQPYTPGTWARLPVKVRFTCVSGEGPITPVISGGSPGGPNEAVFYDGANQAVTASCDAASTTVSDIDVDTIAPTISANAVTGGGTPYVAGTPTPSDVLVSFECSDGGSDVASVSDAQYFNDEGNGQSAQGQCTDQAGNVATTTFGPVWIFRSGTSLRAAAKTGEGAPYFPGTWARAVFVSFSCESPAGVKSYSDTIPVITEGPGQFVEGWCIDHAGLETKTTFGPINIDRTGPQVTPSAVTADGQPYVPGTPTAQNVIVSFACSDAHSGVAQNAAPYTLTTEGANQAVRGICTDQAGNIGFNDFYPIWIVRTPPVVTAIAKTSSGNTYIPGAWSRDDVTVTFTCDTAAGVASLTPPMTFGEGLARSAEGQCRDVAGNSSTATVTPINVDRTPPGVTCATPSAQWLGIDAVLACTSSDGISGLTNSADASFTLGTAVPSGTETPGAATDTKAVCDRAGNCRTAGPIGGNKIDKRGPAIAVSAPADTAYLLNAMVPASYQCSDGGSGVQSCVGSVASGAPLPLTTAGAKTFVVNANDAVGNTSTMSVPYRVTYATRVLSDLAKPTKSGATIPIRFQLMDALGRNVSNAMTVVIAQSITLVGGGGAFLPQAPGNSNPGNVFRFDPSTGVYTYELKTTGLPPGSFVLAIAVGGDPMAHRITFVVR